MSFGCATRMDVRQEKGSGGKIEWKLSEVNIRVQTKWKNYPEKNMFGTNK